jgi:lipopolysaccharide heptosyltransferase I
MTPSDRYLCIRLSALGDVTHALNALALLRAEKPQAFIAWAVEERFAGLLEGHPHVDELIVVPRTRWGRMARNPLKWIALMRERRRMKKSLRSMEFDASIDFQSSLKSTWLVRGARAETRIGFGRPVNREFNFLFQDRCVHVPSDHVHRTERDLALLAPLGITPRYVPCELPRPEGAIRQVDDILSETGYVDGPLIVMHPGTSAFAAFKRWPAERYAAVADRLIADRDARIVLTSGPTDRHLAREAADAMSGRAVLAPSDQGLAVLVELLRRTDLFVAADTGPMHIASALGIPLVTMFGPKDPVQTGPFCSRSLVVLGRSDCRPCSRRKCRRRECILSITVNQVHKASLEVLDGGGRCRAQQDGISELVKEPITH